TLLGQKSLTTPFGRSAANEGYPLRVSELLATLEAPVYIERVALGDNKQIAQTARAIKKMSAVDAQRWVRDVMEKTDPLGVVVDCTKEREPRTDANHAPPLEEIP